MGGEDQRHSGGANPCPAHGSRFAAGEDPVKREKILDGARTVFMAQGFDAASMNDIVREAGVSKGTIYVYFENKEQLFGALIARERDRFATEMRKAVARYDHVEEALDHYGRALTAHMCGKGTICAMRNVIAVAGRMPGLTRGFFRSAPATIRTVLKEMIDREVKNGRLVAEDTDLAARQFIDLATGTFLKFRLFGEMPEPPTPEEIAYTTGEAVKTFMARYGTGPA
ncbi:TetR/AcrR family transcriptional regulator [Rhizobiaceae bacterium BDR2-2]|uniref:TetR/AcrR family transcriptional regulator n=1 Tax=Ectorhizobium quercum TaxID=2965071 RepID=A0AAE3N152_9HYPH|nr:TetR/AcrR family transcriptional regulator [Ectorhizobium quercum]MCX8996887.1 TetR/AcrR family transcriptional regulator [Ectorhizobium quercum]